MIRLVFGLSSVVCTVTFAVLVLRCRRSVRPQNLVPVPLRPVTPSRLPDAPAIEMGGVWVDPEHPALLAAAAVVDEFTAIGDLYIGGETS